MEILLIGVSISCGLILLLFISSKVIKIYRRITRKHVKVSIKEDKPSNLVYGEDIVPIVKEKSEEGELLDLKDLESRKDVNQNDNKSNFEGFLNELMKAEKSSVGKEITNYAKKSFSNRSEFEREFESLSPKMKAFVLNGLSQEKFDE